MQGLRRAAHGPDSTASGDGAGRQGVARAAEDVWLARCTVAARSQRCCALRRLRVRPQGLPRRSALYLPLRPLSDFFNASSCGWRVCRSVCVVLGVWRQMPWPPEGMSVLLVLLVLLSCFHARTNALHI